MSGWFVVNARDADWLDTTMGKFCNFEPGGERFAQMGFNLNVLAPGEPMAMYHREDGQEGFLVLDGECTLVVEGQERPLVKWDFFHCPPRVAHVIVGAGERPALVLAVGSRMHGSGIVYPADPVARRHGAAPAADTSDPKEAYAGHRIEKARYQEGWLPG
ncbi:MAG: cupin domain-containing protein [Acidobacteriota bacterium]|nr:cupin domain-containing protein [Acidobacteriota bacterium]